MLTNRLTDALMPALVAGIHVLNHESNQRRGWPGRKRSKSSGGMIMRFPDRRESDSFWECRRLPILTASRTPT
jgi:hypothetical protein